MDPHTNRTLWFAWGGVADLTVVREMTYDRVNQQLLMWPVAELASLRGAAPLGHVAANTAIPAAGKSLPVFTKNVTAFDFEAEVALPADGSAVSFGAHILAARDPADDDAGAASPPVYSKGIGAVLMVNVSAAATTSAGTTSVGSVARFVSISLDANATKKLPVFYSYNFTLPADEAAAGSINLRILADSTLVEVFVAGGRGVITAATNPPEGGGAGLYLVAGNGGGSSSAVVTNATAWTMCGNIPEHQLVEH